MAIKIPHVDIGDRMTPQATWTVGGTPTDPTQIVVRQQDPAGTETYVTTASSPGALTTASTPLARMGAGVFKLNPGVSATSSGYWFFRFEGTGAAEATEEFQYVADPSEFSANGGLNFRALVGLAETKDWLNNNQIQTGEDIDLVRVINDISDRFYEEADGREFKNFDSTSSATLRTFSVDAGSFNFSPFRIGDLSTAPTLVRILDKDGASRLSVPAGDIITYPRFRNPWQPVTHLQFTSDVLQPYGTDVIEVTGVWGFPSVPGTVRQAVLDAVAAAYDRQVEHYRQDYGQKTTGEGTNVVVFAGRPMLLSLPPGTVKEAQRYRDPLVG
jgi:hypothetical protein